MPSPSLHFPKGFVWGAATSAPQIEGATDARGESVWDRFSTQPGAIDGGSNLDVACDHVGRYREDVQLMATLGIDAYRFSIAWPRVLPSGRGSVSGAGLDFYDRLVDALLKRGIAPYATLFHWDTPQALQDDGGWANRRTVDDFVAYADLVSKRLGDRVVSWSTHNEPFCVATLGHEHGVHAPGLQDLSTAVAVSHHLLLAHGAAVPVIRANAPQAEVGIVLNLTDVMAASPSAVDAEARELADQSVNRWYLDPLAGRGYPDALCAHYESSGAWPSEGLVQTGDLATIAAPIDFLGVNYYFRSLVRSAVVPESQNLVRTEHERPERTAMGWEIYPEGLGALLRRLHHDYTFQRLYITENGAAFDDEVGADGQVNDPRRVAYLRAHLAQCADAINAGVPLAGYFAWSLFDNFEWAYGYAKRFGLVHVDFETLLRTPKRSAQWYADVVANNALPSPSTETVAHTAPTTPVSGGPA